MSDSINTSSWSRLIALVLLLALAANILSAVGHLQIGMSNDHSTLMDQTGKMLAGATPYVEYTDISPPLIHLLYVIPHSVAHLTGMSAATALNIFTLGLIALSLSCTRAVLRYNGTPAIDIRLVTAALAMALLGASFIHQAFADREHLVMVLAAPWFVLYSPMAERWKVPSWLRYLCALLAGIGFAIKPYFYVFYVAVLAYQHRNRPLSSILREREHQIIWALAMIYAVVLAVFFRYYLTVIVPLGLETYGTLSWDWNSKLHVITNELLGGYGLPMLVISAALWLISPERFNQTITYGFYLLAAAVASYALNGGWYYTQYPFIAVALVLLWLTGSELLGVVAYATRTLKRPVTLWISAFALLAVGFWIFGTPAIWRAHWDMQIQQETGHVLSTFDVQADARKKLDKHLQEHPHYLFLATNMWGVNLLQEGSPRSQVGRFDYLWPLPGILALEHIPAKESRYRFWSDYLAESIADDLEKHPEALVIIDVSPDQRALPQSYKTLDFLGKNKKFSTTWKQYQRLEAVDGCNAQEQSNCAYWVYLRKHAPK